MFKVVNLQKVLASFEKLNEDILKKAESAVQGAAAYTAGEAIKNISRPYPEGAVDTGVLRSSITYARHGDIIYRVGTNTQYAPFVEFGTRPHFPPIGDEQHGLLRWVLRHTRSRKTATPVFKVSKRSREAEARSIAFAIAKKIAERGLPPRPYLRPAFVKGKEYLERKVQELR